MSVPAQRSRIASPILSGLLLTLIGLLPALAGAQMIQATIQFSSRTNTPQFLTEMDRCIYFVAEWRQTISDPYLKQVICYNRTTNQTTAITNFTYDNSDEMSIGPLYGIQFTAGSTTYKKLLFAARNAPYADMRLYRYDPDPPSGQPLVKEVSGVRGACNWVKFNNQFYFRADNALYTYNPVNDAVSLVTAASLNCPTLVGGSLNFRRSAGSYADLDVLSGSAMNAVSSLFTFNTQSLIGYGGNLYYGARSTHGFQVFKNSGTELTNYNTAGYGLKALALYGIGSRLVIKNQNYRYYYYDFTNPALPTQGFYNIPYGAAGSNPGDGIVFKDKLYFSANNGAGVQKLFVLGATDVQPTLFGDLSNPTDFYVDDQGDGDPSNDLLYFAASDGINGKEAWQTNGTVRTMLGNIASGSGNADPKHFTMAGRSIFCTAKNGGAGRDLWYKFLATSDLYPPALGGVTGTLQTINDNQTVSPFANVTIADSDTPLLTVRIRLDDPSKGVFTPESLAATGFTLRDAGRYILENKSPAQCQSALRGLVFQPTQNKLPPVAPPNGTPLAANYETTTFTIQVDDGISPVYDNSQTQVRSISVNDAPQVVGSPTLPAVNEDTANPPGRAISALLPYPTPTPLPPVYFSDPDLNATRSGIAVVANAANASSEGAWQYSTNGGVNWYSVGAVDDAANALVLGSSAMLRFAPVANFCGAAPALGFRALDNLYTGNLTSNSTRVTVNTTLHGNPYAVSNLAYSLATTISLVNDAPQLIADAALAAINEDPVANGGATVGSLFPTTSHFVDIDPGSSLGGIAVTGNTANATTQGKWQYSSDGSAWFDIGSVADGATALALSSATRVRFQPAANYNGTPAALAVRAIDDSYAGGFTNGASRVTVNSAANGGVTPVSSASRNIIITVNPVIDIPAIGGAASGQAVNDNATLAPFSSVVIRDPDLPPPVLTMRIDSYDRAKGDFTPASVAAAGFLDAGNAYTKTGTTSTLTSAIRLLVFKPAPNRVAPGQTESVSMTITMTAAPGYSSQDSSTSIIITSINDAPAIGGAVAGQAVNDNATIQPFSTMTVADPDNPTQTQTVTVTFDPLKGALTPGSLGGFTSPAAGTYVFTGTAAAAQTALRGLVFNPADDRVAIGLTETTVFTVAVNDGAGGMATNSQASVISTSVNGAPVIGGTARGQAVTDKTTILPFAHVTLSDTDLPTQTLTVTVAQDDINKGAWTAASLRDSGFSDQGGGKYRFTGTGGQSQNALRKLVFAPAENRVAPGQSETTTLTLTASDGLAADVIDSTTTIVSTSVNDPPVIGGTVAGQALDENATIQPFGSVTISDADHPAQTLTVSVALDDKAKGSLSGLFVKQADGSYTFSGDTAAAQAALRALVFSPTRNHAATGQTETTTFTLTVNDGFPPPAVDRTASVATTFVNQSPVMSEGATVAVTMDEDSTPTLFGLTLHASDADGDTLTWSVSMAAAHGAALASGSGNSKAVTYVPAANYNGGDSFAITVDDGQGGKTTVTVNVTVNPRNDAPTMIMLSNARVTEYKPVGTIIGTLSTADPDTSSTFAYSLVGGSGSADNASFTISGNQLKTAARFIYSAKNSYSIRVRSTDPSGLWTEKAFVISIVKVNAIEPEAWKLYR